MQLLTQMRFGDFLWFATIHLPITSCDVELAALTYGLGLLQGRKHALVPGGRTDFSIPNFSCAVSYSWINARLVASVSVTRHCDLVYFLYPSLLVICEKHFGLNSWQTWSEIQFLLHFSIFPFSLSSPRPPPLTSSILSLIALEKNVCFYHCTEKLREICM